MALALTMTQSSNSEAYRLSSWYLKGIIEPSYYSNAIMQVVSSNTMAAADGSCFNTKVAAPVVLQSPVPPTTVGLKFTNPVTAYRLGIGQVQVINGVTNGWNIVDALANEYYPAYYLQASDRLLGSNTPFTNFSYFPAGSIGFTNNYSNTNHQQYYRVIYAQ